MQVEVLEHFIWWIPYIKRRCADEIFLSKREELDPRIPEIEAAAREHAFIEFTDLDPQRFAHLLKRPDKA
jgi:hypothetical protein